MPVSRTCPVVIRGIVYPSQAEAARAHGVSRAHINQAAKTGRLDTVGLTAPAVRGTPVNLEGVEYPSCAEAHRATGVPRGAIQRLAQGQRRQENTD